MLRMTLILCIGMYAALMIAGVDRGQMRPGLADAAAKAARAGESDVLGAESRQVTVADPVVAAPVEMAAATPAVEDAPAPVADEPVVATDAPASTSQPYVEPDRTVVTALEDPIFSLASVGNEAVPTATAEDTAAAPEVADGGEGTIWYVNASSVNVRAEPSTGAEIVGRLGSGEATLMVQAVDSDWARIVIQGDGVEGFVAMRYLSAEAP
ncbi:MAG: SH3 domain-containing protein [Acetobacteraceae bacterium]|nr:MAG: SH3 domain-containing protein [Acetobacteraceae bacterium]